MLKILNLNTYCSDKNILHNINLNILNNETHIIMGPNGSGKSSLTFNIMGHPDYKSSSGIIEFNKNNITEMPTDQKAKLGIFLAPQYTASFSGIKVWDLLKESYKFLCGSIDNELLRQKTCAIFEEVGLNIDFIDRYLDGFSGGEKKRLEVAQMLLFKPKLCILDEIDSGIDIAGLAQIGKCLSNFKKENIESSIILITHQTTLFKYLNIKQIHIMLNGTIDRSINYQDFKNIEFNGSLL